jgi:hypothetical protein
MICRCISNSFTCCGAFYVIDFPLVAKVFHFSDSPTVAAGFKGFVSAIGRKEIIDFGCGPMTRRIDSNHERVLCYLRDR